MQPHQAYLQCLERNPPSVFEAALWVATEHHPSADHAQAMQQLHHLQLAIHAALPQRPARELAQPLLRKLHELGFQLNDDGPARPRHAFMHEVMQQRRGQPLMLAIIALELAQRLNIPLVGVNFPGHVLLRVPSADHFLDPCTGRQLYTNDCRELLMRHAGSTVTLNASHLTNANAHSLLQRLSRNLRLLHSQQDDTLAALKDAERVLALGPATTDDHLARANLYRNLECPQGERFDLEQALLICEEEVLSQQLRKRLKALHNLPALH